jgi:hypothetical protein
MPHLRGHVARGYPQRPADWSPAECSRFWQGFYVTPEASLPTEGTSLSLTPGPEGEAKVHWRTALYFTLTFAAAFVFRVSVGNHF